MSNVYSGTNVLSLCAGGGGLDLGFRLAVPDARTVCYVENEITACGVLASNMEKKSLDPAPIWTDLRSFDGKPWSGVVDYVIGGYPCQPFSNAGKRLGAEDPRHLWPSVYRIVTEVKPKFCLFENVGAHLRLGGYEVIRDLQGLGYRTAATLLTASEVGAPHGRERLFILAVADAKCSSRSTEPRFQHQAGAEVAAGSGAVGDPHLARLEGRRESIFSRGDELPAWPPGPSDTDAWRRVLDIRPDLAPAIELPVRGVADGLAGGLGRGDQLHILGNGVVPEQAAYAIQLLTEALFD